MTQRSITWAAAARSSSARPARTIPFGEAVASLVDALFATPRSTLPPEVLHDHDPALHEALGRVERARSSLDALHRPLLY